jgi:glycosyltransferase involved in cell wall biosynthesis
MLPSVSAALIVRDESQFIDDCLRSLTGNVAEIVIVDTGSSDNTVEIARRYPIELHQFPWCNDFSAARNYALDRATKDWILYIDADERLEVPDRAALCRLLADRTKAGWELRLHPRVGWTAYSELRLFRNDPRIRFEGVIHERIRPGVERMARAEKLSIGACDVRLRHLGYEADQRSKNSRNIPLLREYLARDPDRLFCWYHLGECLRLAGEEDAAIAALATGIKRLLALAPETREVSGSGLYLSLLKMKHARGEAIDRLADEAFALFPDNLAIQWIAAQLAVDRGDLDAARPVLEKIAAINADTYFDPHLAYDQALFRHQSAGTLALCYFRAGRFEDAARLYRVAARTAPDPAGLELKARLAELRAAS